MMVLKKNLTSGHVDDADHIVGGGLRLVLILLARITAPAT